MDYCRPKSLGEATRALGVPGARVLSGGTDLLARIGRGEAWPTGLVDLKALSELRGIERQEGLLRIGASTPIADIIESSLLGPFPALREACRLFAARAIRNRASLGGNLVNASPAADSVPPLMVHETVCVTDRRRIPIADFVLGPGETVLEAGEILLSFELPLPPEGARAFFVKLAPREAMAISVINFAGLIIERDGKVALARIALGALAPRVVRAKAAESYLEGNELTREIASIAAKLSTEAASPIDDIRATADYRSRMLVRLLEWELFKLAD